MANRIPLVLGPGLLNDADLWAHQMLYLSDLADITMVDTLHDETIQGMARRLLASAPPKFAYAGLSMGGYLAFELLRQAPERITKLALLDTSAREDRPEQTTFRKEAIAAAEAGQFEDCIKRQMPVFLHPDLAADTTHPMHLRVKAMNRRIGAKVYAQQMKVIMSRPDSVAELGRVKVPTLVLVGRQDMGTKVEVHEEIAAGIPGARLCIVEECGHLSTMEQPAAVTALLRDWLLRD